MTLTRGIDDYLGEYDRRYLAPMRKTLKEARAHQDVVDDEEDDRDD
jgi:hypothetical protein